MDCFEANRILIQSINFTFGPYVQFSTQLKICNDSPSTWKLKHNKKHLQVLATRIFKSLHKLNSDFKYKNII